MEENLLEGHLSLCRELLAFVSSEKKFEIGASNKTGINLIRDLVEVFVFPASKMHTEYKRTDSVPMGEVGNSEYCKKNVSLCRATNVVGQRRRGPFV